MHTNEHPVPKGQVNRTATVSSFFFYMWNAWCEEECKAVYGSGYGHYWAKWLHYTRHTACGAAERFYSGLSDNNRRMLVERACDLYDGSRRKRGEKQKDII